MFRKSDKRIWACLKTVKDKWFFTGGWRRIPQSVTHFSNIMAVLVPLWQSSLLICIRITVVTCNHAGLSHLVYPINSRCADVDRQPLVHIHTRTWQNLKKTDKVQKSGYIPRLSFLAFLFFFCLLLICLLLQHQIWMEKIYRFRLTKSLKENHLQALLKKNYYSKFFLSLVDFFI